MKAGWEHFAHGADVGVRGVGGTVEEAFEQAALAMTASIVDPAAVVPRRHVTIRCMAPDRELLLAAWLNAVIYRMAIHNMVFSRFQVRLHDNFLEGTAWGERIDPQRHAPAVEVKGATYTALRVARVDGMWLAQTVLDV